MADKQKKTPEQLKATEKESHKERVAMRDLVRKAKVVPENASNEEADRWLMRHGYMYRDVYKPPQDRVKRLAHNLGQEEP